MESKPDTNTHKLETKTSPAELFSSAQVVAEAAMAGFRKETHKIDKGKAAGAAADLIHAAAHYSKLEEKSLGKYMEKAEGYLHQYHYSHSNPIPDEDDSSTKPSKPTENSTSQNSSSDNPSKPQSSSSSSSQQSSGKKKKKEKVEEETEGGIGGYVKMAEGFLGKQSGTHSSGGGGGVGEYVKLAHGLMKKH